MVSIAYIVYRMKLGSVRELSGMKGALKDPEATGPDPVYWVFSEISGDPSAGGWANLTVIAPGKIGDEYPKTFGHYHPENAPDETYHLINGQGVLVMQRKKMEDGEWKTEEVEEVVLIKAEPGDEIKITPKWGHSWSNIGDDPLISFDDWRTGHTPSDYQPIEDTHGLAYYIIEENGEVKAVPNPKYQNLPEPKWVTASEFRNL